MVILRSGYIACFCRRKVIADGEIFFQQFSIHGNIRSTVHLSGSA